ncbi:MAG: chemotaxis protein CheW [Leptospiraceae bacterium]|nr:chemotaxis protein CheW [Leptospiraceae bacterium]
MIADDLFQTLETEFKELIEKIETEILDLENSQNPEIIHSIFRAIHTIKGNSAMVGMNQLRDISHSLETLFSKIRSREMELKTEMIEITLKSIDRMKEMILDLKNESSYEVRDLIVVLEKFLDKKELSTKEEKGNQEIEEDFSLFLEMAKKENKFLSLVDIDFAVNPSLTLAEWIQKVNSLDTNILQKKIKVEEINKLNTNQKMYTIPYSILFLTLENPEIFLTANHIPYSKIQRLYSIEKKVSQQIQTQESARANSYLKVPTKVIDDLINFAGEAVIARNQLFTSLKLEEDSEEEIRMNRVSQFINTIYNRLMKVRLQKLDSIFPRLQRVTRDTAKSVDKKVAIILEGHDIELDEIVIEGITESLLHIIRNSIDHGIETVEKRIALGKKAEGEIHFKASLLGGNIVIEIKDDGKGLDCEKIKRKALEKNLISHEEALLFSEEQIINLIFLPGFSTNEEVSEVSGRGVGMDVVLTNFKKFGGVVKISTRLGEGTTIKGIIPQTLSVMPAFIISVLGNKFAILQKHIVELHKYNPENIITIDNNKIYKKDEQLTPIIDLGDLLFPENIKEKQFENIAIIQSENKTFGISFDFIVSIEEIVLKPVPSQIKDIELFGGTTLAGDGSAILLLEPEGLINFSKLQLERQIFREATQEKRILANTSYIVFEVSGQLFLIHASEVHNVAQIQKEQIQFVFGKEMIQIDGVLIPSFRLESFFSLKQMEDKQTMFCLILENGETNIGIPIHELIDIFDSMEIKENNVIHNEFVEGISIIEDKTALHIKLPKILSSELVEVS